MELIIKLAADGLLVVIAVCGVAALLWGISRRNILQEYPYAIMAGLTALFVGKLLSLLYQPAIARPFLEKGVSPGALYMNNPGFPSDHALLAGVIILAVYALTPYKKLSYILGALAIIMGIARVLALVHTPLDITGGFVAALAGGLWYMARKSSSR